MISDNELRQSLVRYFKIIGYEAIAVGSALEFYRLTDYYACHVAIVDVGLPDQSGLVLVEYMKKNTDLYIVMLISGDAVEVRLAYYRVGADTIMQKPVDFREISALIGNVFNRYEISREEKGRYLQFGGYRSVKFEEQVRDSMCWRLINEGWCLVSPREISVDLTLREFRFIMTLSRSQGLAVSRKELLQILEYRNDEYGNRALESLVHRIRGKLTVTDAAPIKTAHGVGYSFTAPVKIL